MFNPITLITVTCNLIIIIITTTPMPSSILRRHRHYRTEVAKMAMGPPVILNHRTHPTQPALHHLNNDHSMINSHHQHHNKHHDNKQRRTTKKKTARIIKARMKETPNVSGPSNQYYTIELSHAGDLIRWSASSFALAPIFIHLFRDITFY